MASMDSLRSKVTTIESSLQDSRRSLQRCENQARSGIGIEVVAMRQALLQGDQRISRVTSEVQSFMKLIEDLEPSEVDLKPQVNWLSESIATILRDFETAESQANKAMQQTMNYQYSVNDIGQDIAVRQHDLIEAHKNGVELAAIAEAQLRQSEKLVIWAEDNMNQKTREINNKTTEAVNLRSQLYDYQGALRDREGDLAQAKRKAESKKGKALLGVGAGVLGIFLAPITGGASLVLTGVGASVGTGMAISYDELKDRISSLQSNISSLNFQIREAESSISRLTREKKVLQIRTSELRSKIHTQKSAQYNHQSQIDNAARVQSDISVLQSHANSTSSNVQDVAAELQRLKQNLDRCAAVLSGETTQLRSETSVVERGVPMNVRLVRAFKREQTAVMKATRALELVHLKVPELLPGSNMKFLELEVSSRSVSGAIASEMPPVALITAGSGENVTRKDLT